MDRIASKQVSKLATRKWRDTIPKILKVAAAENDQTMDVWLENLDSFSDGKYSPAPFLRKPPLGPCMLYCFS